MVVRLIEYFIVCLSVRVQIAILGSLNELRIAAEIADAVISQSNKDSRIQSWSSPSFQISGTRGYACQK